jgi:DNA primase
MALFIFHWSTIVASYLNFKDLRQRLSFRDILTDYQIELTEKAGGQAMGYCPLPQHKGSEARRSPSFSAHLERGIFQCFSCGISGNLIEFAALMDGLDPADGADFRKTALKLAQRFGIQTNKPGKESAAKPAAPPPAAAKEPSPTGGEDEPDTDTKPALPVVVNAALDFELKDLDPEHPYLPSRGFTPETIAHFGLGACQRGLMKDRVAIPLLDTSGILIGYAGRVVVDNSINAQNPRYKFPGMRETKGVRYEFHKSEFLYHGHAIAKPVSDLVVVEGFTALWWLWQHGYQDVVGLMGSACSDTQARLILERSKPKGRIWYFADGDPAGVKCAKDTLAMLATSRLVRLVIADGRQPTDFTGDELKKLMPF